MAAGQSPELCTFLCPYASCTINRSGNKCAGIPEWLSAAGACAGGKGPGLQITLVPDQKHESSAQAKRGTAIAALCLCGGAISVRVPK